MSRVRYTEEFKIEAVKQVVNRGHRVADVAIRLGISSHSLYQWIKLHSKPAETRQLVIPCSPICSPNQSPAFWSFDVSGTARRHADIITQRYAHTTGLC